MSERFGTLRSILQKAPSEEVWGALLEELGLWGEEERDAVALPYVVDHLDRWPVEVARWADNDAPEWRRRLANERRVRSEEDVGAMVAEGDARRVVALEVVTAASVALRGELWRFEGLERVVFYAEGGSDAAALVGARWPATLRSLDINIIDEQPDMRLIVEALARNESLVGLETLDLRSAQLDAERFEMLAQSRVLSRVRTLLLSGNKIGAVSARSLVESPYLGQLEVLEVSRCGIGERSARALASGALLEGVVRLDVSNNPLGGGLAALLESPHTRALTHLKLHNVKLDPAGARALCGVDWPPGLEGFDLDGLLGDRRTFETLAGAPILRLAKRFFWHRGRADLPPEFMASRHLTGLRELAFVDADAAVMEAAGNPALSGLESLKIEAQQLSEGLVEALSGSALANNLRSLELIVWHPGIGALLEAGSWGELRRLTLRGLTYADKYSGHGGAPAQRETTPTLTDEDVERLARSEVLGRLELLSLKANLLSDAAALALADSGKLAGLRDLDLRENKIGRAGVIALLRGLPPDALEDGLNLNGNPLIHEDILALAAEPALANLRGRLWIGATDEREETWRALIGSPHASEPTRDQARSQLEILHNRRRTR